MLQPCTRSTLFAQSIAGYLLDAVVPEPHTYPTFVIADSFHQAPDMFVYEGSLQQDLNKQQLTSFCDDYFQGVLKPTRKSAPVSTNG